MQTSEQAGAPAPDSRSIESRIGDWLSSPSKPAQKSQGIQLEQRQPNTVKDNVIADQQPDQVPEPTEATSTEGEPQDEPEATAPAFEEVEYEGETYQVPPKLKEAIIRHSDYTKKTQEVANERKLIEQQQAQMRVAQLQSQFEQTVATERQQIQMLDYLLAERSKANWAQMSTDEIVRAKLELDGFKEQRAALEGEIGKKQQAHMAEFQKAVRTAQEQAAATLKQRIPQWSEATAKETRDWALSNGFTSEEVASIYDPRHAEVLWKASQYDKARSSAQPAVAAAKAAKVGSSNPMPQSVRDKLSFRKAVAKTEGNPHERRNLVEQRIAGIFGKK